MKKQLSTLLAATFALSAFVAAPASAYHECRDLGGGITLGCETPCDNEAYARTHRKVFGEDPICIS